MFFFGQVIDFILIKLPHDQYKKQDSLIHTKELQIERNRISKKLQLHFQHFHLFKSMRVSLPSQKPRQTQGS
jgi:hypothetical protein